MVLNQLDMHFKTPSQKWRSTLEKEMATQSSIPAWEIPRRKEPGGLQCMVSQRVGHDFGNKQQQLQTKLPHGLHFQSGIFGC